MPKIIDPSNLSAKDVKNLRDFFETQHQNNIDAWEMGETYIFSDKTQFQFAHNVVRRLRKNNVEGIRYEFYRKKFIGEGTFSKVIEVDGSLNLDSQPVVYKKTGHNNKSRVVKIIDINTTNSTKEHVQMEYKFASQNTEISMKPPVFKGNRSFLFMRKRKEILLFDLLQKDLNRPSILPIERRINLTKALLIAMKKQTLDRTIMHRDIKPENIFLNINDFSKIIIIDYGLAIESDAKDINFGGSPAYAAPEVLNRINQTSKSDVFSMGRVLALLWHIDVASYESQYPGYFFQNASNINLSSLFTGISVHQEHQAIIREALASMMHKNEKDRFTLDQAIAKFDLLTYPPGQNKQVPATTATGTESNLDSRSISNNTSITTNIVDEEEEKWSRKLFF